MLVISRLMVTSCRQDRNRRIFARPAPLPRTMPFLFQSSLGGARQADRDDILNLLLPNLPNHDEETIVSWLSSQLNLLPPALLDQARTHGSASLICNYDELALQGDATLSHAVIRLMRTFWPNRKVGAYTVSSELYLMSSISLTTLHSFLLRAAVADRQIRHRQRQVSRSNRLRAAQPRVLAPRQQVSHGWRAAPDPDVHDRHVSRGADWRDRRESRAGDGDRVGSGCHAREGFGGLCGAATLERQCPFL